MITNGPDHDADLNEYSLDQMHPPEMVHQNYSDMPFQLDTFNIEHDPIITSATPSQQNVPFSPLDSPLLQHGPFSSIYNNPSMSSSLLNSNDYYSPPGSAYPSAVSTPQPIPENQEMYFQQRGIDFRLQTPHTFSHGPSSLSNSMAPQYMYNANGGSMFTAVSAGGQSNSFTARGSFGMTQHIDPSQVFQSDYLAQSPGVHIGHENMFGFGADSDRDEDEEGAFADRALMMQHEFAQSPMEDPGMEIGPGGLQWDASLSNPPEKQVTIGGTADMGSVELDGSGGSLSRTHASTSNTALMGQRASKFEQISDPNSPPDLSSMSEFSSVVPSRPSSPRGSTDGSSTNLASAADQGENRIPTTCTNCLTQTTPLWRRSPKGTLCNACGLFLKLHGVARPLSLKTDVIKKRNRCSGGEFPGGSTRASASTAPTTQAITRTRKRARPVNEIQSPSSVTSSEGTGGSTFSMPISYGGLGGSSAAASRANPAVRSDCQRRCSKSASVIKSMDLDSLEKCTRSKEAEKSVAGSRSVVDDWEWLREPL